jgi:excisionase family DNA binding protein
MEPLALSPRDAAAFISVSKRTLTRLIAAKKISARKSDGRTLVDVASLKAYYESLPKIEKPTPLYCSIPKAKVASRSKAKRKTTQH